LYLYEIQCLSCYNKSISFDSFIDLQITIPDSHEAVNLDECLKYHTSRETLRDTNQVYCEYCKKNQDSTKQLYLWEMPELLIIQLKRFEMIGKRARKKESQVIFPLINLNFEDYCHPYHINKYTYDLYAVSYHIGNTGGGHYIAYTKNPRNNKWYKYDDSRYREVLDEEIGKELYNEGSYVLFYKKNIIK
jgi:ubiquitin carboxyl-terminal hydrolase 4/11/15